MSEDPRGNTLEAIDARELAFFARPRYRPAKSRPFDFSP